MTRPFLKRPDEPPRRGLRCHDCGARSTGPGWSWLAFPAPGPDADRGVAIVCRRCAESRAAALGAAF